MKSTKFDRTNLKSESKFQTAADLLTEINDGNGSILDIGSRDCELKQFLSGAVTYRSFDIRQNREGSIDFIGDLRNGLPFAKDQFDFVIALDVLEHLDDFLSALDEMVRVAKTGVMISLPNMAHLFFRLTFFLQGRISNKYDFRPNDKGSRHKWLPVLRQSDELFRVYSREKKLNLREIYKGYGSGKIHLYEKVASFFRLPKSIRIWSIFYVLLKGESESLESP